MKFKVFLTMMLLVQSFVIATDLEFHKVKVRLGEVYHSFEEEVEVKHGSNSYDYIYFARENKNLQGVQVVVEGKSYQFQSLEKKDSSLVINTDSVYAFLTKTYMYVKNVQNKKVSLVFTYFSHFDSWQPMVKSYSSVKLIADSSSIPFSMIYENQTREMKAGDETLLKFNDYYNYVHFKKESSEESLLSYSILDQGDLAGSYYHWKSKLPREVVQSFKKQKEVVMLWRWNVPGSFVKNEFTLSDYGKEAVNQASEIKNFIELAFEEGEEVGLVHSIEDEIEPTVFPLAKQEDLGGDSILEYIEYWEDPAHINQIYNAKKGVISHEWSPSEVQKQKDPKEEFLAALDVSVALMSTDSNKLRMILIMSVGPVGQSEFTLSKDFLKEKLKGVKIKPVRSGGYWKGVDYSIFNGLNEGDFSTNWFGKYGFESESAFPKYYTYKAPHSTGFKIINDTASFYHEFGYTEGELTKEVQFQGLDGGGNVLGEVTFSPVLSTSDSALVPIAVYNADDKNGYVYSDSADRLLGFMDEQKNYEVYQDSAMLAEGDNVLPADILYWDEEEIILPVSQGLVALGVYIQGGQLFIPLEFGSQVELFTYSGQRVEFEHQNLNGFYIIELNSLPRMFVVKYKRNNKVVWAKVNQDRR